MIRSYVLFSVVLSSSWAAPVQFNKEIRPLLSEHCFHCHGPDPGSRKAGLRLDTKEGFFEKTDKSGPTVVAGNAAGSPLYQRITSTDPEEQMPPPEAHKPLKPEQQAVLKRWIDEGAPWQPHWSFIKPERPPTPALPNDAAPSWAKNPIDAFVLEKLIAAGLKPAAEADRRTLARRAAYDVTGLPPSPEQVDAFVSDPAPDAYEKYLDALMATPQWGEHRGRYWLDAARYADTHGLHFDNYREMWPYRDWVIQAFNKNMPFDQFTLEQLAGDLLPNPSQNQLVATGFHRCNITTNEGGTIEEENLASYARDRVETTAWVWLGMTANCAVCHDHKFDPIPTKDFYRFSAYFRNTQQGGLDGNVKDSNPSIIVPQQDDLPRYEAIDGEAAMAAQALNERKKSAQPAFKAWSTAVTPAEFAAAVTIPSRQAQIPLNEGTGPAHVLEAGKDRTVAVDASSWDKKGNVGSAYKIQEGKSIDAGPLGDFEKDSKFSVSLWVKSDANITGALLAKMDRPENGYRGWDVYLVGGEQVAMHFVGVWPKEAMKVVTPKVLSRNKWHHVVVSYDGTGKPSGARISVDGATQPLTAETFGEIKGSVKNNVPFRIGAREATEGAYKASVQNVELFNTVLTDSEIRKASQATVLGSVIATSAEKRSPEQVNQLQEFYFSQLDTEAKEIAARSIALDAEKRAIRARGAVTHIQKERSDKQPTAFVLKRGNYDQKTEEVTPGPFSALHAMPANAGANRLGLAKWLLEPSNPLTARVTVNRFWQEVFGTGIVKTAEDFGIVGDAPTHPELLDWLAVEFAEQKWDVKKIFRTILTSQTYRQEAITTAQKQDKDPFNKLLSRGPRFRMDAEMVRDTALAVSGLLVRKLGGASVRPYQPEGVWEAVAMPGSNTRNYKPDKGESLYRRSLYTFWKRAAPPASMEIFNATNRETSCLRRERSNTPMQALVTMNDIQFVEAARVLAGKTLLGQLDTADLRIQQIALQILSRALKPAELAVVKTTLANQLAYYTANEKEAKALVTFGETPAPKDVDIKQLAAWTMIANQLLNLDETLNK